jgi:hypothetical protein
MVHSFERTPCFPSFRSRLMLFKLNATISGREICYNFAMDEISQWRKIIPIIHMGSLLRKGGGNNLKTTI